MPTFTDPPAYKEVSFVMRSRKTVKEKRGTKRSESSAKFQVDLFPLAKRFSEAGKSTAHYLD